MFTNGKTSKEEKLIRQSAEKVINVNVCQIIGLIFNVSTEDNGS